MNKYKFLLFFLIIMLGFTSCSENSTVGTESTQISTEEESTTVKEEAETTAPADNGDDRSIYNDTDIKSEITTASVSSVTFETTKESASTETDLYDDPTETSTGYFDNITYEFTAAPSAADVNDYADKEIAAVFAFYAEREEIRVEYQEYYSALIIYTDGTCAAGIFRNERGINEYLNGLTTIYDADEIICFDVIGLIDPNISEQLNECLNLIDLNNEWNDYMPPYNPDEEYPAVCPENDVVYFLDNEVNFLSSYEVYKFECAVLCAELDDNYAKESRDILIGTGIVDYWLENYAWTIGE